MLSRDTLILLATITIFFAITSIVILIGADFDRKRTLKQRLQPKISDENTENSDFEADLADESQRILETADIGIISNMVSESTKTKLRNDMIRAGIFETSAPLMYIVWTTLIVILFAIAGFFIVSLYLENMSGLMQLVALITISYAGYFIPDIYLRMKTSQTRLEYIQLFPDFLDLLIVCVDAGLSLNAALDRVTMEFFARSKPLATNFGAMLQEIRIGRDMSDALDNLSSRMNVDEIRSFCTLIKQSLELGSDVSDALRVYSDEMRTKRILKAEEEANKLPVKMLLPLGIFIFPVIMIVILTPIVVKVSKLMN